jgi:hypothetical protein
MEDFLKSAQEMWLAPIGGAIVGFLFGSPWDCFMVVGAPGAARRRYECETVIGTTPLGNESPFIVIAPFALAALCWLIATLAAEYNRGKRQH